MMKLKALALIAAAAWIGSNGGALATKGFEDGNALLRLCSSSDNSFGQGVCFGYVVGISDAMERNAVGGFRKCAPAGVTTGQVSNIVLQYLRTNPTQRHFGAEGLVAKALSDAFPCRR